MLEAAYGPVRDGRVICNGRDPATFTPVSKRDMAFAAGRLWDDAKNIAALCCAAEGLSWPVLIAGDTVSPDGISIDMPPNVVTLGRLSARDMRARLAEASVFVAPARYEPFGLAILEAALSGCSLVLGDIPTLREVWGDAALFVAPDDTDALRDTVEALLFDSARSAELGRRARRHAQRYTSRTMAAQMLDAYRDLLASRAALATRPLAASPRRGARA